MKKLILFLVIFGALGWGAFYIVREMRKPVPHNWNSGSVTRGNIDLFINVSGSVEPLQTVQVGSQVSGRVQDVRVEQDRIVKKGEILALIDPELLDNDVKDRAIQLEAAKAAAALLKAEREGLDVKEIRNRLDTTRQKVQIEKLKATHDLALKMLTRFQEMFKNAVSNEIEVDARRLEKENLARDIQLKEYDLTQLEIEARQIVIDRQSLDVRDKQAQLSINQANQALSKANTNLDHASIYSPIDGIVFERTIDPGQTIAAQFQSPNLFKIISLLNTVRITAAADEADIGHIFPGQEVVFQVDAFRDVEFKGLVAYTHLKSELRSNLVTYPVIIEAENPPEKNYPTGRLRPGMTAYLQIKQPALENVLRIPAAALRFVPPLNVIVDRSLTEALEAAAAGGVDESKPDGQESKPDEKKKPKEPGFQAVVYVAKDAFSLQAVPVRVGENDGDYYQLYSDRLKDGDKLVVGESKIVVKEGQKPRIKL